MRRMSSGPRPKRPPRAHDPKGKPEIPIPPPPPYPPAGTPLPQPTLYQRYKESAMRDFVEYWLDVILDILCGERTKPKRKRKRKPKEWDMSETVDIPFDDSEEKWKFDERPPGGRISGR